MRKALGNSLCFGLYDTKASLNSNGTSEALQSKEKLTGLARCVTDFTAFLYLTNVYVLSYYQGEGSGKQIVRCVGEVHNSMPYLRRSMLFTMDWETSVPFYKTVLGMELCKGNGGKEGGGRQSYES